MKIDGLTFRRFRDESDYEHIVELINECSVADGLQEQATIEWANNFFAHIPGFDPRRDIQFATIGDRPVGWVRVWWRDIDGQGRFCMVKGGVLPPWRRRGIGRALQRWGERHLSEIAGQESVAGPAVLRSFAASSQTGLIAMLEQDGYQAVNHGFEMHRPFTDPIPDLPLPEGLTIRSVAPEQYRRVLAGLNEAFHDVGNHTELAEADLQRYMKDPAMFQPHLWQVAWAGDEPAGMVLNRIDHAQNKKLDRLRGWTDPIAVRRPWRKRGVARALIATSMRVLQEQGMTEAALGVNAQNPTGALRLFEGMGFRVEIVFLTYQKPLEREHAE